MGAEPDALVGGIDREEIVPERLAAAFMARATTIRTRKGQLLIAEGSTADDVYLIVGGRLQISMIAANGRETILRDLGPGRLGGELSDWKSVVAGKSGAVRVDIGWRRFI